MFVGLNSEPTECKTLMKLIELIRLNTGCNGDAGCQHTGNPTFVQAWAADQNVETLNNASIIELQSLNLGDAVIVDKIKTSKCDFDVTVAGLKQLEERQMCRVRVIQAMIDAKTPVTQPSSLPATPRDPDFYGCERKPKQPPVGDMNDPNTYHDSGVWLCDEVGGVKKMTQLSTETYDVLKFNGPFGIHNSAIVISEVSAKTQTSSAKPVFYMYFGEGRKDNGDMFGTLTRSSAFGTFKSDKHK